MVAMIFAFLRKPRAAAKEDALIWMFDYDQNSCAMRVSNTHLLFSERGVRRSAVARNGEGAGSSSCLAEGF